ncbi:MAG: cytochrome P450 [Anaerolineales bacterium]|nr:cytochrome P450 [Anaerolineales bacterium]
MKQQFDPQTGHLALQSFLEHKNPLGPLRVLFERVGGFFQIPLPGFKPFVVASPEANRKVLVTERDKVLWRNHDPVTDLLRRGVLVTDGEEHDHYRKLMEPALHPSQLDGYAQMMLAQTERVAATWGDGQSIDMLVESRKIALLIIMQALFSVDVWDDIPRLWTPILKTIEYISPGAWILWRKIPRPGYKKHLRVLDEYLYGIIKDRRQRTADGCLSNTTNGPSSTVNGPSDLLQHLIDAGLDDGIIRDQILTMLIAGHDTSTALLAWTFALLGQHPDIHQQLVAELELDNRPPLLDQVIKETLRLYPPIHIGNRMVAENMEFEGGVVPAGARMFYSIYLTHRDPSIWENADGFCPARFERGRKTPSFSYVPFGGGPRACIGAAFGQAEARLVLAYLLKTFTFQTLNSGQIRPHMGATLEPRPGVMMSVTRREQRTETRE